MAPAGASCSSRIPPSSAEFIENPFRKHHYIEREGDRGKALDSCAVCNYELYIVSLALTDYDGLRFCTRLRSQEGTRRIPVLAIANPEERRQILRGLDLGAGQERGGGVPGAAISIVASTLSRRQSAYRFPPDLRTHASGKFLRSTGRRTSGVLPSKQAGCNRVSVDHARE